MNERQIIIRIAVVSYRDFIYKYNPKNKKIEIDK